jgi:acyl-CoA reductase-like NAD-dependent aldehyde dehydrogenase
MGGTAPVTVDALGPRGPFRSRAPQPLLDVCGSRVGEVSLLPAVFVDRAMAALRQAEPAAPAQRADRIAAAARLFATGTPDGRSLAEDQHLVSRVGGLPISVVRAASRALSDRLSVIGDSVAQARPRGAVTDWRDPVTGDGAAVWTRRGEVLAVHAAGNNPGTHSLWPEALALGYRVAVRPSSRDPFTPYRLISALRAAGFGDDEVVLLPTDHDRAGALLRGADRSVVYGGQDVVDRYAGDPSVLPQGPGRSKLLLAADVDWREHLDVIVASVSDHAGTGCVNTTAVFVEGDPAPLCAALAERLSALPSAPPEDEKAVLPVQPVESARGIAAHLRARAAGARPWLGAADVVDELGDGSAVLRPAVHQLDRPDAPLADLELPFPCVWVAPWRPSDGVSPLRDSLVLTALTGDASLVDRLVREPTIGNVYLGDQPTYRMGPGLPHDGYLAEFLMRAKTVFHDRAIGSDA